MGEFELINTYFARSAARRDDVALGIGDDCALLVPPTGAQLAVSIDTLVEGVHFLPGSDPALIAERLLGAAVSDLAAMAAEPAWFTLALTLPTADINWLEPFAAALARRAAELNIALVGGDTTRGPLALSVQVHGWVKANEALTRSGAREGDLVLVSGTLGDSRGGLQVQLDSDLSAPSAYLRQRFFRPEPRIALARGLCRYASAAIDLSDGLVSDLGHIARQSGLAARINLEQLPLSAELEAYAGADKARQWALSGGEDFELCLTIAPERLDECQAVAAELQLPLTCVGQMQAGSGVSVFSDGQPWNSSAQGYDHFGEHFGDHIGERR
ncbi:thiamine-phosphate kinase [Marinobacterium lutimaris]|uniref:Thiamine-monophosphate kinase n=1 Tax=Marinobacterium lutimaris TaxID=568106 RepID=A0A1H6D8E7_9GAMM|nr:thiamine-phosphate kinase [Marinobacterium lutimaris]SEG81388.1 thiamine-phosphate kinase [Marinobacterium lutimaris]